jgi:hypothetical protein
MKVSGKRKRGGKPVEFEWEKEGLFTYLRIVDASGKAVAVVDIDPNSLRALADGYGLAAD